MSTVSSAPAYSSLYAHWLLPSLDPAVVTALASSAGVPIPVASLLLQRGVADANEAAHFLHPSLDHLLDPYGLHGMAAAVARIQQAIAASEPILIYGDYDVDGTTAIVLLKAAIEILGGTVRYHIPHRLRDGYGMQAEVLTRDGQDVGVDLAHLLAPVGIRGRQRAGQGARASADVQHPPGAGGAQHDPDPAQVIEL